MKIEIFHDLIERFEREGLRGKIKKKNFIEEITHIIDLQLFLISQRAKSSAMKPFATLDDVHTPCKLHPDLDNYLYRCLN